MEIITGDRPGLLATIGRAFLDCNIRVHDAKISTIGETAENIFMISDSEDQPIDDPASIQKLIETVKTRIDKQPSVDIVDKITFW